MTLLQLINIFKTKPLVIIGALLGAIMVVFEGDLGPTAWKWLALGYWFASAFTEGGFNPGKLPDAARGVAKTGLIICMVLAVGFVMACGSARLAYPEIRTDGDKPLGGCSIAKIDGTYERVCTGDDMAFDCEEQPDGTWIVFRTLTYLDGKKVRYPERFPFKERPAICGGDR